MGQLNIQLTVSDSDREQLEALVRRARIVLLLAEGVGTMEVARRCEVSRPTVSVWRWRYPERGLAGLHAELRPGQPCDMDDERIATLINTALHTRPEGATHCSVRSLADATELAPATVHRYLWRVAAPHTADSTAGPGLR